MPQLSDANQHGRAQGPPKTVRDRAVIVSAVVLLAAYVLPLFSPPSPHSLPFRPELDEGVFDRIYAHVGGVWMTSRLLALFFGALLLAYGARATFAQRPIVSSTPDTVPASWATGIALLAALAHVGSLPWIGNLGPTGQNAYLLWLFVPAAILAAGSLRTPRQRLLERSDLVMTMGVVVVWFAVRLGVSWRSPRAADLVDMWRTFPGLVRAAMGEANILTQSLGRELVGINASPHFMQGLPVFQTLGLEPTFPLVQAANAFWLAVTGIGVGFLCAALAGSAAAPLAAAAFLFSPFIMLGVLNPTPMFVGAFFTMLPALLLLQFARSRQPGWLAAAGPAIGLAASHPPLAAVAVFYMLIAVALVARLPRLPVAATVVALCGLLAALLPSLPGAAEITRMNDLYSRPAVQHAVVEEAVLGQLPVTAVPVAVHYGREVPFIDTAVAVALTPVAFWRRSMRHLGDVVFEPVATCFFVVGLLGCLAWSRRSWVSTGLVTWLVASLAPALISSTDVPSLMRMYGAPVPVAVIAAFGWSSLFPRAGRAVVLVAALVVAVSGSFLFDVVNPKLVGASATGLTIQALAANERGRGVFVSTRAESPYWRGQSLILSEVPFPSIAVRFLDDAGSIAGMAGRLPGDAIVFWSPAVEGSAQLGDGICGAWAGGTLFTIRDDASLSSVHAATRSGSKWRPAVSRSRWESKPCRRH